MCVRIVRYVQFFFSLTITNVFEKLSDWNYNIRLNEITKESFGDSKTCYTCTLNITNVLPGLPVIEIWIIQINRF